MSPVYPLATSRDSLFSFYDIESLANVFTLCSYTPRTESFAELDIFFLIDDASLIAQLASDPTALQKAILTENPGLPERVQMNVHNLGTAAGAYCLANSWLYLTRGKSPLSRRSFIQCPTRIQTMIQQPILSSLATTL